MSPSLNPFFIFQRYFFRYTYYVHKILIGLVTMIIAGGFLISYLENVSLGEGLYFSFITGLTIGYGDITPVTTWGRVLSVAIGLVGIIFTGVSVAVATRALADTVKVIDQDMPEFRSDNPLKN